MKKILTGLTIVFALLIIVLMLAPALLEKSRNQVQEHAPYPVSKQALELHEQLLVADLHADSLLWDRDINKRSDYGHIDLPRMLEGNMAIQFFTTVTKAPRGLNLTENSADSLDNITLISMLQMWPPRTWQSLRERALYQADKLHKFASESDGKLVIVKSKSGLKALLDRRTKGETLAAGILGTEGSHALEGNIENVQTLYNAGFRMMSLQHFFDNQLGGSLHGVDKKGLSAFGRQVVDEIARLNILLDLSHSSKQVVLDVLERYKKPIVISHTGVHGHCQSQRNISDELMQRIAKTGGVIGIGFWDMAVCEATPKGIAKAIQYAVNLLGEDHVALGSDYDGAVSTYLDVSEMPAITHELLALGLAPQVIAKVMGGNVIGLLLEQLPETDAVL